MQIGAVVALVGLLTLFASGPGAVGAEAQIWPDPRLRPGVGLRPEARIQPGAEGESFEPRVGRSEQERSDPSPGQVALLSAVLPGSGQYVLGQRRSWAYLALETVGWVFWVDRRSAAADLRTRYRDFAWTEARLWSGPRVDGDFEYYERLGNWLSSGLFDAEPATEGVQPESDPATFNGATWALATGIFLSGDENVPETDPGYQSALEYYRDRAYGPEFLWDWTGKEAEQEEFGSLIRRSDDRFRQATNILGLVLVNHAVSMVDAYVSARAPAVTVRSGFAPSPARRLRWTARVDVTLSW